MAYIQSVCASRLQFEYTTTNWVMTKEEKSQADIPHLTLNVSLAQYTQKLGRSLLV